MIQLLIAVVIIGVILYFIETFIPMDPAFKAGVRIIAAIVILLMLLNLFGMVDVPMNAPLFRTR